MNRRQVKLQFLTSLGVALEYYDFVIYGHLAAYITAAFSVNAYYSLLYSYMMFSLAYFVRPLGGILAGLLADKFGRFKVLIATMLAMAFATLSIGLVPLNKEYAVYAFIMIMVGRVLQGLAFGAEMPSAIVVSNEIAVRKNSRTLSNSALCLSATLGAIFASVSVQLLHRYFEKDEIAQFAWRLPFLFGGTLALIALYMRTQTKLLDVLIEKSNNVWWYPLQQLYTYHKQKILLSLIMFMFTGVLVVSYIIFPTYLSRHFYYEISEVYKYTTVGLIVCACVLPVFGYLARFVNTYLTMSCLGLLYALLCVCIIKIELPFVAPKLFMISLMVVHQIFIAALNAVLYGVIFELFNKKIAATSTAIAYNFGFSIAALLPVTSEWLLKTTSNLYTLFFILMSAAVLACLASLKLYFINLSSKELAQ